MPSSPLQKYVPASHGGHFDLWPHGNYLHVWYYIDVFKFKMVSRTDAFVMLVIKQVEVSAVVIFEYLINEIWPWVMQRTLINFHVTRYRRKLLGRRAFLTSLYFFNLNITDFYQFRIERPWWVRQRTGFKSVEMIKVCMKSADHTRLFDSSMCGLYVMHVQNDKCAAAVYAVVCASREC